MKNNRNSLIIITEEGDSKNTLSNHDDYDYLFKFHLIGDPGVGKSCLLLRYTDDTYAESYISTIGADFKNKIIDINGKKIKTQVWDYPGQKFRTTTGNFYRGAHAVIAVFDLTDKSSLLNLNNLLSDEYGRAGFGDVPIILVGNKSDDRDKRSIETEDVTRFIEAHNAQTATSRYEIKAYIVASAKAKTGNNVQSVFETTSKIVLHHKSKDLPLSKADQRRNLLIQDLKNYINRIESYKKGNTTNFAHGFWHHESSRAVNREASYLVAKQLLNELNKTTESIESIFTNVDAKRDRIIQLEQLYTRPYYKNRGINSSELNKIIKKARKYVSHSESTPLVAAKR